MSKPFLDGGPMNAPQPDAEPVEGEVKSAYFEGWRHGLNAVVDIDPDTGPIADDNPNDSWLRSNARARVQPDYDCKPLPPIDSDDL